MRNTSKSRTICVREKCDNIIIQDGWGPPRRVCNQCKAREHLARSRGRYKKKTPGKCEYCKRPLDSAMKKYCSPQHRRKDKWFKMKYLQAIA